MEQNPRYSQLTGYCRNSEECQPVTSPPLVILLEVYLLSVFPGIELLLDKTSQTIACWPEGSCCQQQLQATPNVTPKETNKSLENRGGVVLYFSDILFHQIIG